MKNENITRFSLNPDNPPKTDWSKFDGMSDEIRHEAALSDPDSQPATEEQLTRMRRSPNLKAIRQRLNMTQEEFARSFLLSLGTVRDWEQGSHHPDHAGRAYLRVIEADPTGVLRALGTGA